MATWREAGKNVGGKPQKASECEIHADPFLVRFTVKKQKK